MIAFLSLLLHVVVSPFKTRARLEAEIIMLRHQRRRFPSNTKLVVADRYFSSGSTACFRR
jgi:hypothetical protein